VRYSVWGAIPGSEVVTVISYASVFVLLAVQFTLSHLVATLAGAAFGIARESLALLSRVGR